MLTIVFLRDAEGNCFAPGLFLGRAGLVRQIRQAAGQPEPAWLTDAIARTFWPDGDSITAFDYRLRHWIDSRPATWLLASADTLRTLLPQVNGVLLLDYPELTADREYVLTLADLAAIGFAPQVEAGTEWGAGCPAYWSRPSAADLLSQAAAAGDCDLHLHTSCSDGTDTPEQMVDRVIASGLAAFAITDHDSISALEPARLYLASRETPDGSPLPRLIPGIELSIEEERELHLLGYFPRGGIAAIGAFLVQQQETRRLRNEKMIGQLQKLGYPISFADFEAAGTGTIGRLQAAVLLRDQGYFPSITAAFDELLAVGRPAYVDRQRATPAEAIWLIRQAGGVAVIAHPHLYGWCGGRSIVADELASHLEALQADGLQGVEAFHGEAAAAVRQEISAAALALGLIRTGGSDDHGINKDHAHLFQKGVVWLRQPEILVVAAIISGPDQDGQPTWLLTRRSSPGHGRGFWEFPGGKVEPGESLNQALTRELAEELAVQAMVGKRVLVLTHDYPERRVILVGLRAVLPENTWQLSVHDAARFVTAREALELPLLPADIQIFETLLKTDAT